MTEFVRVKHPELDGEADVAAGSLDAWKARGWEAISEPRSFSRAQDEETIRAQEAEAQADQARAQAEDMSGDRVDQILKKVGTDPVLAAEALKVESSKTQPRVTLVAELERIAGSDPRTAAADTEE